MSSRNLQIVVALLLGVIVVLLGFIAGRLMVSPDTPALSPSAAVTPSTTPQTAPPDEPQKLTRVNVSRWTPQQNGCTVAHTGTQFHISGTNDQDGWDHWNGPTTTDA